jgi:hypothetical protein
LSIWKKCWAQYTQKVVQVLEKETGTTVDLAECQGDFLSKILNQKDLDIVSSYPNRQDFL